MYQRAVDYTNKNWIDLREHYAQYDEYCIPPNDTWRGVLLLLFLSYIIPAFVFLASMMKKRVISVVDESKQSVVRRRSIALFFFFYSFALVYVGSDLKDLFFTKLWCFFTIPLLIWQILSFCWRRLTPKLFWVANGVFMFVILILLMAEFFFRSKNYISEGLVSGWSVLAVLMGAFHIIAFIISIVLLVVVCIKLYFETKEKETDGVTM